jgi:hypothetical protein
MTACLHPLLDVKETTPVYVLEPQLQLAHQLHLLSNGSVQDLKQEQIPKNYKRSMTVGKKSN